ncbi:MAG TPA: PDZ domain-containing protein [Opitutaceae bacterium]
MFSPHVPETFMHGWMCLVPGMFAALMFAAPATAQWGEPPMAGAGISLQQIAGRVVIAQVLPGGPAEQAGIRPGDELVAVDGYGVQQMAFDAIPDLVRGPEGSQVVLVVSRAGQYPRQVAVVRQRLNAPTDPQPGPAPMPPPIPEPSRAKAPRSTLETARQTQSETPPPLPAPGSKPGVGTKSLKFTRVVIRDPAVNNLDSFVFLLPEGWQHTGQIVWMHDWAILANTRLTVTEPRSGATLAYLPVLDFIWFQPLPGLGINPGQNYIGKMYLGPITDPVQFVEVFWAPQVLPHLQGRRPVKITELPRLGEEFGRRYGGPGQGRGYRLRYKFDHQGRPWAEEVTFALLFTPPNSGIT